MAGSYPHPQAPVQPYSELEYDTHPPPIEGVPSHRWRTMCRAHEDRSATVTAHTWSGPIHRDRVLGGW